MFEFLQGKEIIFYLTIFAIAVLFIFDTMISILNYSYRHKPIPENVADVYNKDEYKKWLDYTMELFRVSILSKIVRTLVLLVFLAFQIFPKLALFTESFSKSTLLQAIYFLGLYGLIVAVFELGFSIYKTFSIEERYGFNRTTVKTFISDRIKTSIIACIIGVSLLYPLLYLYDKYGNISLVFSWIIIMSFALIINVLNTRLFIKLFNKMTPLPEGELFEKTKQLAMSMGFEVKKISVIDASKRSTRLNAFFTGFGRFKNIVLFDTLLEKCSTDEVLSVLAHEIGHAKHKDALRNLMITSIEMAAYLGMLSFFLSSSEFSITFGFSGVHYGFAIILFGILLDPLGVLLDVLLSAMSRKAEYLADACATKAGYGNALIHVLKILAKENFSNLTPHPLVVRLTYSHPPVTDRINAIEVLNKN